jgi:hypothetical protein
VLSREKVIEDKNKPSDAAPQDGVQTSWVIWFKDGRYSYAWRENEAIAKFNWLKAFSEGTLRIVQEIRMALHSGSFVTNPPCMLKLCKVAQLSGRRSLNLTSQEGRHTSGWRGMKNQFGMRPNCEDEPEPETIAEPLRLRENASSYATRPPRSRTASSASSANPTLAVRSLRRITCSPPMPRPDAPEISRCFPCNRSLVSPRTIVEDRGSLEKISLA